MFFIFLIIFAGLGYFIYQKYVTPTGNEPTTTKTDPIYPSKTPKPLTSSSSTNVSGKGAEASTSKFGKSTVSKSPVKKPRSPRPIQVITLGIGGDDLAPGVVSTAQAPASAPVSTPPPSLQAPPVLPLARDLNNNVPTPAAPATPPPAAVDLNNNVPAPASATPPPVSTPAPVVADVNNNVPAPAPIAATESSSTRTAIEPADSTQDDKSDKRQITPPAAQVVQSPTPDVVTARSPAPSEIPPPSAAAAAAALDDKPSEDVKTAKIINENSLREKSEGEISSPAPVTPEAGAAAPTGGGSEREKANNNENDGTASTQSAPPGTVVDPAAAALGGTDGKKKKAKKSKDGKKKKSKKNSSGGKSGGTEDEKKKKKKSKKTKDGKKKKSKKNSGGGEKGPEEKKSEDDATPPAPAAPPAPGL